MTRLLTIFSLLLAVSACQSSQTKIDTYTAQNLYHNDIYLGCISAYTHWQIRLNNGSKYGEADSFCRRQRYLIEKARQKKAKAVTNK